MTPWMIYLTSVVVAINSAASLAFCVGLYVLAAACALTGLGNFSEFPIAPKYLKLFALAMAVCGVLMLFVPNGDTLRAILEAL